MDIQHDVETITTEITQEPKEPRRYRVLLLNDDFTPMDFVVLLLEQVFFFTEEKAYATMLAVHCNGQAVCGIYAKDIAQMKVDQVVCLARANEHPLQCIMEEE